MTAKEKIETAVMRAVKLEEVPRERFSVLLQRTILGGLLVALGVLGILALDMNHYLSVGLVLVGATTWSGQVVTGAIKAVIEPLKSLLGAVRGNG